MVAVNTTTGCSGLAAPSMGSSWNSPCSDLPWEEGWWWYRRESASQGRRRGRRGGGPRRSRGGGRRRREHAGGARHYRSLLAANASRAGHGQASGLLVSAGLRVCARPPCAEPPLRRRIRTLRCQIRCLSSCSPPRGGQR